MRATGEIQGLFSNECKHVIVRNLSRILDIRIADISLEGKTISIIYETLAALEKVKMELRRIGYPMLNCTQQETPKRNSYEDNFKELKTL